MRIWRRSSLICARSERGRRGSRAARGPAVPERDKYSRIEYRRLIAWPQRIEREAPLLEKALSSGPSRRLLDLGCGTGEHARFLVSRGFEVVAMDASESMLASAAEEPLPAGVALVLGDIRQVGSLVQGEFGGAICLGNTLPHLRTAEDLRRLFAGLRERLLEGAPVLLQLLNYERIFARQQRHLPLNFRSDGEEEIVFLRLMALQEDGEVLFFPSTLRLVPGAEPPLRVEASKQVRLRGWRVGELVRILEEAGFKKRTLYGNFDEGTFEPTDSPDLIVVAR